MVVMHHKSKRKFSDFALFFFAYIDENVVLWMTVNVF